MPQHASNKCCCFGANTKRKTTRNSCTEVKLQFAWYEEVSGKTRDWRDFFIQINYNISFSSGFTKNLLTSFKQELLANLIVLITWLILIKLKKSVICSSNQPITKTIVKKIWLVRNSMPSFEQFWENRSSFYFDVSNSTSNVHVPTSK